MSQPAVPQPLARHRDLDNHHGWHLTSLERPRTTAAPSEDGLALHLLPDRLRLVVADGASTNPALSPTAVLAHLGATLQVFADHRDLPDLILDAARLLHDPEIPLLTGPLTALAVLDLLADGRIEALRAGDCELWARAADTWHPVLAGPRLTPEAAAAFDAHPGADPTDRELHWQAHLDVLTNPHAWRTAPLGLFPTPLTQEASLLPLNLEALILATDGARLDPHAAEEIFRGREPAWPGGDVALFTLRRLRADALLRSCASCGVSVDAEGFDAYGEICCSRPDPQT